MLTLVSISLNRRVMGLLSPLGFDSAQPAVFDIA